MAFEVNIRVTKVTELEHVGPRQTPKRLLVGIDHDSTNQHPRTLCFEAWSERANEVFPALVGRDVCVSFVPESREWNGRYFTSLRFIGCTELAPSVQSPPPPPEVNMSPDYDEPVPF